MQVIVGLLFTFIQQNAGSTNVPEVLTADDACFNAGSGENGCAVQALQRKAEGAAVAKAKTNVTDNMTSNTTSNTTSNITNCFVNDYYFYPNIGARHVTSSAYHCQALCYWTPECATFSYFPDQGCQFQEPGATPVPAIGPYAGAMYGPKVCPEAPVVTLDPLLASAYICLKNPSLECCKCGACCLPYCNTQTQEFTVLEGCPITAGGFCGGFPITGPSCNP